MRKTKVTDIVYKPFANEVIKLMEGQIKNPKKRWDAPFNNLKSRPINAKTKNIYRGINSMMTTFDTYFSKYEHCLYATKKQWSSLGCEPKKDAKPLPIVFYKPMFAKSRIDPTKDVQAGCILLYSKAYNVAQVDGDYQPPVFKTGKQYSIDAIDKFVKATNVDALAIAIGTSHGAYKFTAEPTGDVLRIDRIKEIHARIPNTHLVMHGSSSVPQDWLKIINDFGGDMGQTYGVPVTEIQEGIKNGVRKVNIDTDLRMASTGAIRKHLTENTSNFDPRKFYKAATNAMSDIVAARFEAFGAAGQADSIKVSSLDTMSQRYLAGELDAQIK